MKLRARVEILDQVERIMILAVPEQLVIHVTAFVVEAIGDAGVASFHHQCGFDTVARADAGEDKCLLDVVVVEQPLPRA